VSLRYQPKREPDGFESYDFAEIPYWFCDLCSQKATGNVIVNRLDLVLCDECAEEAANLFWRQRSGEFLTWPNPKREKGTRNRPEITREKRQRVFERDHYRCRYCGGFKGLVLDHVHPFSRGGSSDDRNLVTACWSCNGRKHDRTPEEAGMVLLPEPEAAV
jgi:5-methylcytosine-specific restriction endonuclease McrA